MKVNAIVTADTQLFPLHKEEAMQGIYQILNTENGKRYIGSSTDIKQRWQQHRTNLSVGRSTYRLQRDWNKFGEYAFEFSVLEEVSAVADLPQVEQKYMDQFHSYNRTFGYNLRPIAESSRGIRYSAETRKKFSTGQKKRFLSVEERKKQSDIHLSLWKDPEYRAKQIAARKRVSTPQHMSAMAKKLWSEHKERLCASLSAAHSTEEYRANRRRAMAKKKQEDSKC